MFLPCIPVLKNIDILADEGLANWRTFSADLNFLNGGLGWKTADKNPAKNGRLCNKSDYLADLKKTRQGQEEKTRNFFTRIAR